jgi:dTDP-4-dehydrorhamnose 3,5-epimerase
MYPDYQKLSEHLQQLEAKLRRLNLWSADIPDAEAFKSTAPFCYDSMPFEHWLQWVFIPLLQNIVENEAPFPENCAIAPMGEVAWREIPAADIADLIRLLGDIDIHICTQSKLNP